MLNDQLTLSDPYLGPGVVSEKKGGTALQLLLGAQVTVTVAPVDVEGHEGRVAGGQPGPRHRHTGTHHLCRESKTCMYNDNYNIHKALDEIMYIY